MENQLARAVWWVVLMVLYGFTLEMSLREGQGCRQAGVAAYFSNAKLATWAACTCVPCTLAAFRAETSCDSLPAMFLPSLGEQGVCGLQQHCWADSGQFRSMDSKNKKPLNDVAFTSVSVSTALLTSASVVLDRFIV